MIAETFCIQLVSIVLLTADADNLPSCDDIVKAVVANRERIQSLQVRAKIGMPTNGQIVEWMLFVDVKAQRWRVDFSRARHVAGGTVSDGEPVYFRNQSVWLVDGVVYERYPQEPNAVARKSSIKIGVEEGSVRPFPDPRNAGLVCRPLALSGTPFERGGSRLAVWTDTIDFRNRKRVSVSSVAWRGEAGLRLETSEENASKEKCVLSYVVVPDKDYSVVFNECRFFRAQEPDPYMFASVDTEISLHTASQFWFPAQMHYRAMLGSKQEEITDLDVVSLNEPISEAVFTFKGMGVPVGHRVMDLAGAQKGKEIWDGDSIVKMPGNRGSPPADAIPGRSSSRLLGTTLPIVCVCLAILLFAVARQRSRRTETT